MTSVGAPGTTSVGPAATTGVDRREDAAHFFSVLFPPGTAGAEGERVAEPGYFPDLNLDQFVSSVTAGRDEYSLASFFYEHLDDLDTLSYRQEVFSDLEDTAVFEDVTCFARQMREVRAHLEQADELHYRYQKESWFLDAVSLYCDAVTSLSERLARGRLSSRGMLGLRSYLASYVVSAAFTSLVSDVRRVRQALSEVHYSIHTKGPRVTVTRYDGEEDYCAEVLATFERFKQGDVKDYRVSFRNPPEMNHVEANVLTGVATLHPEVFGGLDTFCERHADFLDPTVRRFDREVQFYTGYLEHLRPLREAGLSFCYPEVTTGSKNVLAEASFDLALATKLVSEGGTVVPNHFHLSGAERVLVVSGPNQGGKTTFARMFGQLHHLATIGCPVPGTRARLSLFDEIYTHFEREENLSNMTGKLEDDLVRIRDILSAATSDSVIVVNEIFASTTLSDALFLGTKVIERLTELDVLSVVVTFVEELSLLGPATVSMVSTVRPENPVERTYNVVRMQADGLAYALAIAEKYGLTQEALRKRLLP